MRAALIAVGALVALALAWWVVSSIGPSDAEAVAVAKAEAKRWQGEAREAGMRVKELEVELTAAKLESGRVDTIIRTVLRTPVPVRPVTPPRPVLDSMSRDSLLAVLLRSEAYADAVTQQNTVLRATLDTASNAFSRYREAADSVMAAQARQIGAQRQQISAMQTIIDIRECRILGFLKCPSRTVTAIGSAVVTAGAVIYVKR